jgi:hypothetical protein
MSKKKKNIVYRAKKPLEAKSAQDFLEDMPAYSTYRKFMQLSMVGCLMCISGAVLLRINAEGFDEIILFLNVLAYALVGSILFIWLSQLRPMRKSALRAAKEFNATLTSEPATESATDETTVKMDAEAVPLKVAGATTSASSRKPSLMEKITKSAENGPAKESIPKDPEYLRYRLTWRLLLFSAAVLIIIASVILRVFEGDPGLALTVQVAAIIPVAGAIYIYRVHLRPLKQKWNTNLKK